MSQGNASEWTYLHSADQRNSFFGEVQHRLTPNGDREVVLIIKPGAELGFELSCAALAIDGSKSMMPSFAAHLPPMLRKNKNTIHPIAHSLAMYLADNAHGQVAVVYWACGDNGSDVEPVGMMSRDDLATFVFGGPKQWGGGTKLAPVVQYFWDEIFHASSKPGVAVILTDGAWDDDDHRQLGELTARICTEISAGRSLMKIVLVGLRSANNAGDIDHIQSRFSSLDEFNNGGDVDLWDHKWLDEMADMSEIFVEMVQEWPLGVGGYVDVDGTRVFESDELRFRISFTMPALATSFTLHINEVGDYAQQVL